MEKLRVLIADGDDDRRKHMVVLICTDYQVVGAVTNGEDLVKTATCLLPDVIVSDISTPLMDGLAARNKLIARAKLIPFVFVTDESQEIAQVLRTEPSVAFVRKSELSMDLVHAVAAVYHAGVHDSPVYVFNQQPEEQNVVLIDEETLRKAERMILSCERCNSEAETPFEQVLDRLTASDPRVTDYILKKPGACPNCSRAITEKTLVEIDDRK